MIEYIRELLNKKLEQDMELFDKKQEKKDEIELEQLRLSKFKNYKYQLKADRIRFYGSLGCLVMIFGMMIFVDVNILFIVATLLCFVKAIQYKLDIVEIKKVFNTNYLSYTFLTSEELYQLQNKLENDLEKIDSSITVLEESINTNIQRLSMVDSNDFQEFLLNNHDIYLNGENMVDTAYSQLLDYYLNKKIDYSSIHFNHHVDDSMATMLNHKKLMKKM